MFKKEYINANIMLICCCTIPIRNVSAHSPGADRSKTRWPRKKKTPVVLSIFLQQLWL